jgi:hypothetical protein
VFIGLPEEEEEGYRVPLAHFRFVGLSRALSKTKCFNQKFTDFACTYSDHLKTGLFQYSKVNKLDKICVQFSNGLLLSYFRAGFQMVY